MYIMHVLFLKFPQIHDLMIDLSETAIEPENNNIFKHTCSSELSIFLHSCSCGHPPIHKKMFAHVCQSLFSFNLFVFLITCACNLQSVIKNCCSLTETPGLLSLACCLLYK